MDGNYWRMIVAFVIFWAVLILTATAAFFAGRSLVQMKVEVAPASINIAPPNVNVSAAKSPTIEVNVPTPSVNIKNEVPANQPPVINVENRIPQGPAPVVNVLVDGKKETAKFTPPTIKEEDPDGKLLPPPQKKG